MKTTWYGKKSTHHILVCSTTQIIQIPTATIHFRVAPYLLRTQPGSTCLSGQTHQRHEKKNTSEQRRADKKQRPSNTCPAIDTPSANLSLHQNTLTPSLDAILQVHPGED